MTAKTRFGLRVALVLSPVLGLVALTLGLYGPGFVGGIAVGFVLGIVAVAGGMGLMARIVGGRIEERLQPAAPEAPQSQSWDYVMQLRALDDQAVDVASFRGRVLFLNFWASWCAPCVAEMPSIERLIARLADTDVAFVCVTSEPVETVRAFLGKRGWRLPVYRLAGEQPAVFETRSIPATFVVSPDGGVAFRHLGAARWDSDQMVKFLREAAAASTYHRG